MKLFCANYESPLDNEGTFENVYIEEIEYNRGRKNEFFYVDFEMYHFKNGKRVRLGDIFRVAFTGSNDDMESGLPTTNKTSVLRVKNQNFNPETPQYISIPNPNYDENVDGSEPFISVANPDYLPEYYNINLLKYLSENNGQMPEEYEVIDWGWATCENAMQYFQGGTLTSPELFIQDAFAREWLKHNVQMKGQAITEFNFID